MADTLSDIGVAWDYFKGTGVQVAHVLEGLSLAPGRTVSLLLEVLDPSEPKIDAMTRYSNHADGVRVARVTDIGYGEGLGVLKDPPYLVEVVLVATGAVAATAVGIVSAKVAVAGYLIYLAGRGVYGFVREINHTAEAVTETTNAVRELAGTTGGGIAVGAAGISLLLLLAIAAYLTWRHA